MSFFMFAAGVLVVLWIAILCMGESLGNFIGRHHGGVARITKFKRRVG